MGSQRCRCSKTLAVYLGEFKHSYTVLYDHDKMRLPTYLGSAMFALGGPTGIFELFRHSLDSPS
jgi:hypothetical protein